MAKYLILIIVHLLGDFYLQTTKIAQCKNARKRFECGECKQCKSGSWINWKYLFVHSFLYTIPFCFLGYIMQSTYMVGLIVVLFMSHAVIDALSCYLNKKSKQSVVFIFDQALHLSILYMISRYLTFSCNMDDRYYVILKVGFICLMLIMPCSILINKLFKDIYPESDEMGIFDVGSIIGIMERVLTFIFAYFESFPVIAIIITVKTWARTNDLKETEFRNKYLLGTLTSLTLALIMFVVYKSI